jgi:hypothetical protein
VSVQWRNSIFFSNSEQYSLNPNPNTGILKNKKIQKNLVEKIKFFLKIAKYFHLSFHESVPPKEHPTLHPFKT